VYRDIELNIMPFVDVFSMLNTFLLFSAVFISIGMIEVQIPFLSNAPPPKKVEKTRDLDIKVNIAADKVEILTSWTAAPVDEKRENFPLTEAGMADMHNKLIALRRQYEDTDKVTVFSDDDVIYEKLALVLDTVKLRKDNEPQFSEKDIITGEKRPGIFLYPKVVIGSVLL